MTQTLAQVESLFTNGALAAAGAAAVSIPIVIHLLTRLRRRPQRWGAMRFLMQAYRRHRTRLQLEQLILLLVRCLILIVLGLALAGPLLGGCARDIGLDAGGRLVAIVMDDSLSTSATSATGGASGADRVARFERLRRVALKLLDQLGPSDRVSLWRAARPGGAQITTGTLDHKAVRRQIESMTPRASRGELAATLAAVSESLREQDQPKDRTFVVLLSDWAPDALPLDRAPSQELVTLGGQARLLAVRPGEQVANVQIESLVPGRRMVLATGTDAPAAAPITLRLRRFADTSTAQVTNIHLSLQRDRAPGGRDDDLGAGPQVEVTTLDRQHRWSPGESQATLNVDVPVDAGPTSRDNASGAASGGAGSGVSMIVRAAIDDDALAGDNQRWATIELRQRLMVGIVDEETAAPEQGGATFKPRQWLSFALAPRAAAGLGGAPIGGVELAYASASALDGAAAATWDAAMVLRPDMLGPDGWAALKQLVDRGGLVWVFVPAEAQGSAQASWGQTLPRQFNLDWTLGIEAVSVEANAGAAAAPAAPAAPVAPQPPATQVAAPRGWRLKTDGATPEPLRLLAADWEALVGAIHVYKRLPLTVRGDSSNAWLRLETPDADPLLVTGGSGEGEVVFLATALDPQWTNLPAKPLFVPLLHETLRGVLGRSGGRRAAVVCGDQPVLGRAWDGAQQLVRQPSDGSKPGGAAASAMSVLLRRTDAGFVPVAPLLEPGVYAGAPGMIGRKLAVNVDAVDGDTRVTSEKQLEDWFASLGDMRWLDDANPIMAMMAYHARANVGWPLLWATLGLVLLELCLARWFSHAHAGSAEGQGFMRSGAASFVARAVDKLGRREP